jgi:hypothetical protein
MDENIRKQLEAAGWTRELLEIAKAGLTPNKVDAMFLENAQKALAEAGYSALEFLALNPGVSESELAKRLNRGVSAIGLVMAIYKEATRNDVIRVTAKDLLIRKIYEVFPEGWTNEGDVGPAVKMGGWDHHIKKYIQNSQIAGYATKIITHLTIDHRPTDGWRPKLDGDPVIEMLFNRYWPIEPNK